MRERFDPFQAVCDSTFSANRAIGPAFAREFQCQESHDLHPLNGMRLPVFIADRLYRCGRLVRNIGITVRTACGLGMWMTSRAIGVRRADHPWSRLGSKFDATVNGRSSTGAAGAGCCVRTGLLGMTGSCRCWGLRFGLSTGLHFRWTCWRVAGRCIESSAIIV